MELAIPIIALGGLYMASKQPAPANDSSTAQPQEGFSTGKQQALPNTDIPNKNYPSEYPVVSETLDKTSKLSTVNTFEGNGVYTDKYFKTEYPETTISESFTSMTGDKVSAQYFKHNNMTPYFGAKNRSTILEPSSTESVVDNYTGGGSQYISKSEQSPLFSPGESYHNPHGAPNQNDFYQSRVNPSMRMANMKPFESVQVGPGLGLGGATNEGQGGYNSGMAVRESWMPKTVDELRTANNPRSGGFSLLGHEGPANNSIKTLGAIGKMEKNRVERTWELGPERSLPNSGLNQKQSLHAIPVDRHVNRPDTSTSYVGAAGSQLPETYQTGEYMESKHMDLGQVPLGIATLTGKQVGTESDFERKSQKAYLNNRNTEETYFGAFSGAVRSVVAPLLDELRPSRKENAIGTMRPYQNAHTGISSSYLFNPNDRPDPTNRQTTEKNKYLPGVNSNQRGGAYETTDHRAPDQQRDTTSRSYVGNSSAADGTRGLRPYDAEYRQRNNDIKSSTIQGHMVKGNMNLHNGDIHMRNREGEIKNQRPLVQTSGPREFIGADTLGAQHGRQQYQSNIQMDRNNPEILDAFRQNPYTHPIGVAK
jgi:hypothetical protein